VLAPSFLIARIGRLRCTCCRKSPWSEVKVFGQAILPACGDRVTVRIEYYCDRCNVITASSKTLSSSEAAALLVDAIREGRFVARFRDPVNVLIPRPTSPSVVKGTPTEPIDDSDVHRADRILRRTSFRRSSKSWGQFLNRVERGR
jgi:hypothetical protein